MAQRHGWCVLGREIIANKTRWWQWIPWKCVMSDIHFLLHVMPESIQYNPGWQYLCHNAHKLLWRIIMFTLCSLFITCTRLWRVCFLGLREAVSPKHSYGSHNGNEFGWNTFAQKQIGKSWLNTKQNVN